MLYFTPEYALGFLPLTLAAFFATRQLAGNTAAKLVMIAASLIFYGVWNLSSLPVLVTSILVNLCVVEALYRFEPHRRTILIAGLAFNLGLLAYFKYANFVIANVDLLGFQLTPLNIFLPLGISFFTFQKIALLVDVYKRKVAKPSALNFALFVTFFPQLIAGPIVHHSELMPQFDDKSRWSFNVDNFNRGVVLFCIGFIKKLLIADRMAIYANNGFAQTGIGPIDAWCTALSYTFQLYFDFSGFIDMGIGSALMLNIKLPENFLSPYKAPNIQEFWRRWHITLGRFLRDYVYIPLGGSQRRTLLNLFATFVIGGLWHGAAWTFVAWGALHGAGLCAHRLFQMAGLRLPRLAGIALTFWFVVVGWVLFRATTLTDAWTILTAMHNPIAWLEIARHPIDHFQAAPMFTPTWALICLCCFAICFALPNSMEIVERYEPSLWHLPALGVGTSAAFVVAFYLNAPSPFLYFNF